MKDIALKMLSPTWLLCVVLLMVGYQLVIVICQFWTTDEKPIVSLSPVIAPQATVTNNKIGEAFQFDLFGMASSPTEVTEQDAQSSMHNAPQSMLKLDVSGIVSSSNAENSIAIIVNDNHQVSVGVGERVPGYDATITDIFKDYIIIKYQGRNETLFLNSDKPTKNNANDSSKLGEISARVAYQPKNIFDFVNVSPVMVSNKLNGYRLNPGKDSKLFYHVGLQDDDLAVSLNGSDLRDSKQSQQIMEQLPELTEIKITVERDGQLHDVFIAVGGGE